MTSKSLPKLVFIHIPKTAGTSVRASLTEIYGDLAFHGNTTLDYQCYSDEDINQFRFYSGHAYSSDVIRLTEPIYKFSVFRNPVNRAISLYYYYKKLDKNELADDGFIFEAVELAQTCSIIEFIYSSNPFLIEHLRLGQIRQFLSKELLEEIGHRRNLSLRLERFVLKEMRSALSKLDGVFTTEILDKSLSAFLKKIGVIENGLSIPKLNVTEKPEDIDILEIWRAVMDVSILDFEFFNYAREIELSMI